jgi:endonuclease/exonuclease/phosphatase family metal-dependent hydrolase
MTDVSDKLDLILQEIREMKKEQQEMKKEQQEMKKEQQEMKKEQQFMKTEQQQQGNLMTQLIHIVKATNQKVSDVQEILERHENTFQQQRRTLKRLERNFKILAVRSIEQEAELQEVKREVIA